LVNILKPLVTLLNLDLRVNKNNKGKINFCDTEIKVSIVLSLHLML